jgi:DNA topoisomerase-1
MASAGLGRVKVVATIVRLLETTMIRIGNAAYARENRSFGLTTLRNRHVRIEGADVRFRFIGKGGKIWNVGMHDRRLSRIVRSCQELPGQHLFQYLDETGERQSVTSSDVNAYLKEVTGFDVTAKDFRTWAGTVLATIALADRGPAANIAQAKRNITLAIASVSARLGNTPAICRKSYVHPEIFAAYLEGAFFLDVGRPAGAPSSNLLGALDPEEEAVLSLLLARARADAAGRA